MTPYYSDEAVSLYHGDCREILPSLDVSAAATITDPPYAVRRDVGSKWDRFGGDLEFLGFTTAWLRLCAERSDVQVIFFPDRYTHIIRDAARYASTPYRRSLIWRKPPGSQYAGASMDGFWFDFEPICVFGRPAEPVRTASRFGVIDQRTVAGQGHGCEKPLPLLRLLVDAYTQPGELVIEPFAGTGSTLRAAKDLGRRAIGVEQDEAHCEAAAERLRQEVFEFGESA